METSWQNTTPMQHSTPGESRAAHSKKPAFVPPFLANAKTKRCKNAMLKDNTRTPSAFVPPFKKQRAVVQESSFRPLVEEKEDKHHRLFNSNTCIAATKKKQCTTELAGSKSEEDSETVASADNKNDEKVNNSNLPIGCGSEGTSAKTSLGEDLLSRCQGAVNVLDQIIHVKNSAYSS